jgi:hypothetical protein
MLAFTDVLAASEFELSVLYWLLLRMYDAFLMAITEICAAHQLNRNKNNRIFKNRDIYHICETLIRVLLTISWICS